TCSSASDCRTRKGAAERAEGAELASGEKRRPIRPVSWSAGQPGQQTLWESPVTKFPNRCHSPYQVLGGNRASRGDSQDVVSLHFSRAVERSRCAGGRVSQRTRT